ncbi:Modular serine protease [Eumeta japonica]|uniref:Modular serine protease n=1 Tax=Eumeta variegata TaxID=151549 RepID=A0A4C1YN98_EUMVA|nr:Modular serine protease [Eumeta japonica]
MALKPPKQQKSAAESVRLEEKLTPVDITQIKFASQPSLLVVVSNTTFSVRIDSSAHERHLTSNHKVVCQSKVSNIEGGFCRFAPVTQKVCPTQYPENGSYIVINNKAGPGDAFDDLSLILYTSDKYFELEVVYLAVLVARGVERSSNAFTNHRTLQSFDKPRSKSKDRNKSECCKLPPYPEHGLYVVAGDARAAPGAERARRRAWSTRAAGATASSGGARALRARHVARRCAKVFKTPNASALCELPAYPEHGQYDVLEQPYVDSGENNTFLRLYYECEDGYGIVGPAEVNCSDGAWSDVLPTCVGGCRLDYKTGVIYSCKKWRSVEFSTDCQLYEPNGAEVLPVCDTPDYRSNKDLPPMKCVDGNWNYTPACLPECGIKITERRIRRETPIEPIASGGWRAQSRELPWHVGIYNKLYKPYMQICGGSIISAELVVTGWSYSTLRIMKETRKVFMEHDEYVLSFHRVVAIQTIRAAHCFWSDVEGLAPSSRFAVGAGKLYRPWSAPFDSDGQLRDVNDIVIPKRFRGIQTNFQDDIAIVYVSKPFVFDYDVWPVCVDFDLNLDRTQLTAGNLGKVAGWGFINEDGHTSPELQVVRLPYVEIDQCIVNASPDFRAYITSDKICAGHTNGTALCKGDSGGGLVFAKTEKGRDRHYLRGVASTAPNNDKKCNTHAVPTFTHILAHEHFIKDHLNLTNV